MKLIVEKTEGICGEANVPSSKSHTIRAFFFASLAEGKSTLENVLESEDANAAIDACSALGSKIIRKTGNEFEIIGFDGHPNVRRSTINTLNSGTTTNFIASVATLANKRITIDGDESIRRRPVEPLLSALRDLGATAFSVNNNGCPPIEVQGKMKGGETTLDCISSQYLSSLLISCPLLDHDTEIRILNICEVPYVEMTLKWLDELGIRYDNRHFETISIPGEQRYPSFERTIPADWSSATFLLVAGAMLGCNLDVNGLDLKDTQSDREVLNYLRRMGADIKTSERRIVVNKAQLQGCELDLNNTPDALPAMAVIGCYANGRTVIKNVSHARLKETDRISVMAEELSKFRARIKETDDGMIIEHSRLKGTKVDGRNDHRVVMALSLAGMIADGKTEIETAQAISATFPNYVETLRNLGARMKMEG